VEVPFARAENVHFDGEALRRQDAAEFEALYHAFAPELERYLSRLIGDPFLAQDLLQDTFVKAYRALPATGAYDLLLTVIRAAKQTQKDKQMSLTGTWKISISTPVGAHSAVLELTENDGVVAPVVKNDAACEKSRTRGSGVSRLQRYAFLPPGKEREMKGKEET
jgi:hypothetical protein